MVVRADPEKVQEAGSPVASVWSRTQVALPLFAWLATKVQPVGTWRVPAAVATEATSRSPTPVPAGGATAIEVPNTGVAVVVCPGTSLVMVVRWATRLSGSGW